MKNLFLIVMFASNTAAAQEFSFDADAMGKILAGTMALKVKHDGRPRPPMVSDYEARHIGFRLRDGGRGGDGRFEIFLEIYFEDSLLATLHLNDRFRRWADAERVLKVFEALRRDALAQKRRIVIDYDAIHRHNKAGAWSDGKNPKENELFNEIIRLGLPPAETAYRYDPKDLRFEKTEGEVKLIRVNDVLYKYSTINVRHKGAIIATFHVYDPKIIWRGWETDKMLMESLESIRLSAMRRGLPLILDYTALARHNGPGSWEPELLGEIIRAEKPL